MQKLIKNISIIWNRFKKNDEIFWQEIEEQMILNDVSFETASAIIKSVRQLCLRNSLNDLNEIKDLLKKQVNIILSEGISDIKINSDFKPLVWLIVGVNGVGKTSAVAKITNFLKKQGKSVLITAADTFRSAANEQIEHFAKILNVPVVRHQQFSDPGAVVYDSIDKAIARKTDIILVDTAGRMHTSYNLMEELKKIKKVVLKKIDREPDEILMVIDSTTGQNAKAQVACFHNALNLSGIILTKTDGTSKGGIILTIKNDFKIPIKFITNGEGLDNLEVFNPEKFTEILLG